ncbi:DoxX family protein (plasmid) [Agrobacterium leguminum]|uniref:DoxX family protein n=1 Tax=Agrobacterium leguminum TaxID=2792015 RepID=UPI0030D21B60
MIDSRIAPYAVFLMRLTNGVLLLLHAGLKVFVFTPAGSAAWFGSIGLPPALAYIAITWEIATGVALILGLWPRIVAVAATFTILGGLVAVHWAAGFFFNNPNGGWEFPAYWIIMLLMITLLGDGAFALKPSRSPSK